MRKTDLSLLRATPRHIPLIKHWLAEPAVRRGWGRVVNNLQELREDLSVGQTDIYPYLICLESKGPVGYVQVSDSLLFDREYIDEITPGGFNIDIFIALPLLRGRGIGSWAIREARRLSIIEATLEQTPPAFYAWILESNRQSQCAFEKCGYRLYEGSDAPELLPATIYWLDGTARK